MKNQAAANFEDYFSSISGPQLEKLIALHRFLRDLLPEATEAISYQIPTFKINGKNIVHFAAYPKHIGFYPGAAVIAENQHLLSGFKFAKGSIQFQLENELPFDLIRQLVAARMKQFNQTGR